MISEAAIKCFLAAAENGSFTRTAEELYMTRQAVSKQIAMLEKELEVKLFRRTTAKVELTPEGVLYADFFTRLQKDWEKVHYQAKALAAKQRNTVRLGTPYDMDLGKSVYQAVDRCADEGMVLKLEWERSDAEDLVKKLLSGKLDIIFSFGRSVDEVIERQEPVEVKYFTMISAVLAVGKRHPLVSDSACAADFQNEPCFVVKNMLPKSNGTEFFKQEWKKYGLNLKDVRAVSNRDSAQTMVLIGAGVSICTDHDTFVSNPEIVAFPLQRKLELYCMWRSEESSIPVLAFLDGFNSIDEV